MKIKCLAVVGALLLAGPASAATVTETAKFNKNKITSEENSVASIFTLIAGSYDFGLSVVVNGNSDGSVGARLIGPGFNQLFDLIFTNGTNVTKTTPINLAAGQYHIDWSGGIDTGTMVATATLTNKTVAVPGPEAGAGIGALAMASLAYAVTRRRKQSAAA